MKDQIYHRAKELLEADLNDELVALEPEQGNCFGFNAVAASVWRHLEQPRSFAELKAVLLAEYEVDDATCEAELRELLASLEDRGLVAEGSN